MNNAVEIFREKKKEKGKQTIDIDEQQFEGSQRRVKKNVKSKQTQEKKKLSVAYPTKKNSSIWQLSIEGNDNRIVNDGGYFRSAALTAVDVIDDLTLRFRLKHV